ncbi:MAG: ABC transporter substrate-binding protein [Clostridia bacterium]|nr:ABC transporter substrate-binding protein [Clostridia bacterium]
MKKIVSILFALMLCLTLMVPVFASAETDVQKVIAEAASMSWDDLLAKAQAEIGSNELHIYGTTSRVNEETFTEKTGIKIVATNPNDSQIYELLENETGKGIYGPDVVLTQDSFMLVNNAIANGWLENYVPGEFKDNILESDQNPLVCSYYTRLFFYNNGGQADMNRFTNVWQFTEPEFKGLEFKNPVDEKTSMNFLISLTSEKWQQKLADAYKSYYGKEYAPSGDFANISYEWIYKFLMNCTFISKDSTIASDIAGGAPGSAGLFVFSKLRSVDATNISICAKENIEGFGGLLYPIYIMVASNAKYPYAACLYVNYLMSEEGYQKVFGKDMGSYSANSSIGISENAVSYGDEPLAYWQNCTVIEDPAHIQSVYAMAYTQIAQWFASK